MILCNSRSLSESASALTEPADRGLHTFAQLDVELNGSNSIYVGIHELPPGSPSFRTNPQWVTSRWKSTVQCFNNDGAKLLPYRESAHMVCGLTSMDSYGARLPSSSKEIHALSFLWHLARQLGDEIVNQDTLTNDDVVDILNDLLENARDGADGFVACAEQILGAETKQVLVSAAAACARAADELTDLIRTRGGIPVEGGNSHRSAASRLDTTQGSCRRGQRAIDP